MAHPDAPDIAYVVAGSQLYRTINAGDEWQFISPEGISGNLGLHLIFNEQDAGELFLLDGKVYKSEDYGNQWELLFADSAYNVFFIDTSHLSFMLASQSNHLYKSTDGGVHWKAIDPDLDFEPDRVVFWHNPHFPEVILATYSHRSGWETTKRASYITHTAGDSWSSLDAAFFVEDVIFDPFVPETMYLHVSADSEWRKTTNGGDTWMPLTEQLNVDDIYHLTVDPANPGVLYVIAEAGRAVQHVYRSTNGGTDWSLYHTFSNSVAITSLAISPRDPNIAYAASYPVDILYSANGGASWQEKPHSIHLSGLYYVETGVGNSLYAGIEAGGIYSSTDYGSTWQHAYNDYSSSPAPMIPSKTTPGLVFRRHFDVDSRHFALAFSENSGIDWSLSPPMALHMYDFDVAADNQTVYMATRLSSTGDPIRYGIAKSTDRGHSWNVLELDYIADENSYVNHVENIQIDPHDKEIAYAVAWIRGATDKNVVIRTTDGGINWTVISEDALYYLNPHHPGTLYAFIQSNLYISSDYGDSWRFVGSVGNSNILDLEVDPNHPDRLYVVTQSDGVFMSTDKGSTWITLLEGVYEDYFFIDLAVNSLDAATTRLYVATQGQGIKRATLENVVTTPKEPEPSPPQRVKLNGHYPNPFHTSTIIAYSLAEKEKVVIEIFNAIGRRVRVAGNEVQPAGLHTKRIDMEDLPSGVYFYTITAGDFQDTQMMVMVK